MARCLPSVTVGVEERECVYNVVLEYSFFVVIEYQF